MTIKSLSGEVLKDILSRSSTPEFPVGLKDVDDILWGLKRGKIHAIAGRTSMGKCLDGETEILMYSGDIKRAKDIKTGDLIMGVNSQPRRVLSTCSGTDDMYKIELRKGDSFICNSYHILSLKSTGNSSKKILSDGTLRQRYSKGDVVNISVLDYIKKSKKFKHVHKSYHVGVEFKEAELSKYLCPYFLGLWLGDGNSDSQYISTTDKVIMDYLKEYSASLGMELHMSRDRISKCFMARIYNGSKKKHPIKEELKRLNLLYNKHIPLSYKVNSRENRLQLLAGLIDSDGYNNDNVSFIFSNNNKSLCDDIVFLAKSLGFSSTVKKRIARIKSINYSCVTYRVYIGGDVAEIPVKLERKKINYRPRRAVLSDSFSVTSVGVGKYYGFELDGDGLFLLGNFIVTHNTSLMFFIANHLVNLNKKVGFLNLEMTNKEVVERMFCMDCKINNEDMIKGKLTDEQKYTLEEYIGSMPEEHGLSVADRLDGDWGDVDNIKKFLDKNKVDCLFLDYIQMIRANPNQQERIQLGQFSVDLDRLAKEYNIAIVYGSQMNRAGVTEDSQSIPKLHHFKGSGTLEENAHAVMIVHWYWKAMMKKKDGTEYASNEYAIYIAKNRGGRTGLATVNFIPENYMFENRQKTVGETIWEENNAHNPRVETMQVKDREGVDKNEKSYRRVGEKQRSLREGLTQL